MSHPRPLFSVGEEVGVVHEFQPRFDTPKTEITFRAWVPNWNGFPKEPASWGYDTAQDNEKGLYPEHYLRKLPPEEGTSWSTCIWIPKELSDA